MTCREERKVWIPNCVSSLSEQLDQIRKLAIGPNAAMVIRSQELELVGKAEKLIVENTDLSVRLTAAVDRLVSEAELDIGASAKDALSVQRLSAQTLLSFAVLSLLSSTLIVWLYVGRNIIGRLMLLNSGMLAIIERQVTTVPIEISRQRRDCRNGASRRGSSARTPWNEMSCWSRRSMSRIVWSNRSGSAPASWRSR